MNATKESADVFWKSEVTPTRSSTTQNVSQFQSFEISGRCCWESSCVNSEFPFVDGEVTGIVKTSSETRIFECQWKIVVPNNHFLRLEVDTSPCRTSPYLEITYSWSPPFANKTTAFCVFNILLVQSNVAYFRMHYSNWKAGKFRVSFSAVKAYHEHLDMVMTSSMSGYIISPGYNGRDHYGPVTLSSRTIVVPDYHTVFISFERFDVGLRLLLRGNPHIQCTDWTILSGIDNSTQAETQVWKKCGNQYIFPQQYRHSLRIYFSSDNRGGHVGFKMRFSLHKLHQSPQTLNSGLYNCSVYYYAQFKQHVDCNMLQECEGREDEGGHCPFSSPACDGSVDVGHKCFTLVFPKSYYFHDWDGKRECEIRNSTLAMAKTRKEWKAISIFFHYTHRRRDTNFLLLGYAPYNRLLPQYYRKTFMWLDNSVDYIKGRQRQYMYILEGHLVPQTTVKYFVDSSIKTLEGYFYQHRSSYAVCQSQRSKRNMQSSNQTRIPFPSVNLLRKSFHQCRKHFVKCPLGHVTAEFLGCHPQSECGVTKSLSHCPFSSDALLYSSTMFHTEQFQPVATFQCKLTEVTIPYSFVCDFLKDCMDDSDEDFCIHNKPCLGFQCKNRQCIEVQQVCDSFQHCEDGSDESACSTFKSAWMHRSIDTVPPPAVIDFDGTGHFKQTPMQESEDCPSTHFRCPGELDFCLPVYVLCNGVYDCLDQEDEAQCDGTTVCPGFYRCWDSNVCVHADHVCDGWPQCPRHDDELLCDVTCPEGCRCQGQAFVCHQPFPTQAFPDLRYLDASGSGLKPHQVADSYYLVLINLKACRLTVLPKLFWGNLIFFNLDENQLTSINMDVLLSLQNLQVLSLAGNPLVNLHSGQSLRVLSRLHTLDLARTHFMTLSNLNFTSVSNLLELNLSHCKMELLTDNGFKLLTNLRYLDISGNPITEYPRNIFHSLTHLRQLSTTDFKFCCRDNLPKHLLAVGCLSPKDEVSSCQDLLRSGSYRTFVWIIGVMSIIGNAGSFFFRCVAQKSVSRSGFNIFVTNLCLADLLMGVYLAIVGVADTLYRGKYLWHQNTWMSSLLCHTAGFLSLLSSEVSAFIICLITLDRFIVLRFPFTTVRFGKKSAVYSTLIVWTAGVFLASIPFLPLASQWKFYGHSGICIPLPITRRTFQGRDYAFGVIIVLNFILFLFIAVGQAVIYLSIRANVMVTDTTRKSLDTTIARRLLTVVMSDFVCWFPIGLLGLLASAGLPISGEVNVAVAIFVLPLNSALNPFLYTVNTLVEVRRKSREVKLIKLMEAQLSSHSDPRSSRPCRQRSRQKPGSQIDDAVKFIDHCLESMSVTLESINTLLQAYDSQLKLTRVVRDNTNPIETRSVEN